ncbi:MULTISPECIES: LytR/AlgR family response regulator transcription factor [Mesoflavibacter]|uniref:LytTR family DNA-binding domain-containing protein n=1 Tax=Mesoflavibacter profundi TaxID=2708110 RepID=A0ABT4RZT5_9FLAO|nr:MULTISPECIES: LytTR family DNA-binding domain-containing protein [Mesoflavibacter]MDA0177330.1 LytTR family DNA-binding domain-containing protein [Mesoflavibacter profundi]QIJ88248.1 Two-component transcriptional response regulator, LuxR family [Mesoflavibacter sp. HG96]QIJ90976.1 Two-component transcriptional response regulator, LuxR family [Mesoflavibacter sp. HG37]
MKALIIDDEKKARQVLQILVEENCPKITTILQADNLMSGVELIKQQAPNIVFLDIEMPEHSGLEILNFIEKEVHNFEIIFTTAYSEYAIQAFQLSAIDYLLKPVRPSQVKDAVDKAIKFLGNSQINKRLTELKSSLEDANFKKIGLPNSNGIKFVDFTDIIMFEADGMYTNVTTQSEGDILVSKPLKFFVDLLQNIKMFYRPHRSFLINLAFIKEYIKKDGGYIVMENDKTVSISNDKKEEFLTIVQNI